MLQEPEVLVPISKNWTRIESDFLEPVLQPKLKLETFKNWTWNWGTQFYLCMKLQLEFLGKKDFDPKNKTRQGLQSGLPWIRLELGLIFRTETRTRIGIVFEETNFESDSEFYLYICGTGTILIYFQEPESKVLFKSKEQAHTDLNPFPHSFKSIYFMQNSRVHAHFTVHGWRL
jgi:hypothetical protein